MEQCECKEGAGGKLSTTSLQRRRHLFWDGMEQWGDKMGYGMEDK